MATAVTDRAMAPVADEDFTSMVLPDKAVLRADSLPALCDLEGISSGALLPPILQLGASWTADGRHEPDMGFHDEERLSCILEEGITVFYALQLEVPPQESMEDGGGSHHRAGGLADETPYRPLALAMAQVDAVRRVQLTAVDPRDVSIEAEKGISAPLLFRRFGIQDMGIPDDPADTLPVVAELQQMLREGKRVYLHCRGGVGRAGTIASCLLVYMYDISAEVALERIQKAYDTRGGLGTSPETEEQKAFVHDFADALKSGALQRLPVGPEAMTE